MESLTTGTPRAGGRRALLARIIESEIDLASGIVIERVAEEPPRPRRRLGRSLVLLATLAGLASGLAAGWVPSPGPTGSRRPEIVGTGVQVAALRTDVRPGTLDASRGLGAWARATDVTPEALAGLAARGVRTLFVESAGPEVTAALLVAAHRQGLRVVAWYRPAPADPGADGARAMAASQGFDGLLVEFDLADDGPGADGEGVLHE